MIEGESGLLAICPPWASPVYEPSKRRLTWPNGSLATAYSADKPDVLRGPQHDTAWADELATWRYREAWDNLMLGLRLGDAPRCCITTTPKPVMLLRELIKRAGKDVVIVKSTSYENRDNLSRLFFAEIAARYEGTRMGRQELLAEMLEQAEGALWKREMLERNCIRLVNGDPSHTPQLSPEYYRRIVVAIDPSVTANPESSNECGVIACGLGQDGFGYVLDDRSAIMLPDEWARQAIHLYDKWRADAIIGETNNGGEMVGMTVRQAAINMHQKGERSSPHIRFRDVRASRGKYARAEPVAALWEQDRCKQLGVFAELELQLCSWEPMSGLESPDRLDALVWAMTDLMLGYQQIDIGMPFSIPKNEAAAIGPMLGYQQADVGMPFSIPKNEGAAIGPIGTEQPPPASQTPRNRMIRSARPEDIG